MATSNSVNDDSNDYEQLSNSLSRQSDSPSEALMSASSMIGVKPSSACHDGEPIETDHRMCDSWAEDQKRKWEQLEPWMFEQFGGFVEIV
jgi:hypothetical protein